MPRAVKPRVDAMNAEEDEERVGWLDLVEKSAGNE